MSQLKCQLNDHISPFQGLSTSHTELFDPDSGSWSRGVDLPSPRQCHALAALSHSEVLIAGGRVMEEDGFRDLSLVQMYDLEENSFKDLAALNIPR